MADTERNRIEEICKVANVKDIGELSDGFHTFNGLYEQRMILFAALVKTYKDKAWKSYRHEDGEYCFGGGWFIVGIDTPEGSYTYHYENKYWNKFECIDLPRAPHWDGHTEKDVTRLLSLPSAQPEQRWIPCSERLPDDVEIGEEYPTVIFCTAEGTVHVGGYEHYLGGKWWYMETWEAEAKGVIAWMPLPEPWRGEEDEHTMEEFMYGQDMGNPEDGSF